MRFRVSQFGSECYGGPLCGWRVADTQAPSPVFEKGLETSRILAVYPTKKMAEDVADKLNEFANDMTSKEN